jgi:hypothetical protein
LAGEAFLAGAAGGVTGFSGVVARVDAMVTLRLARRFTGGLAGEGTTAAAATATLRAEMLVRVARGALFSDHRRQRQRNVHATETVAATERERER